MSASRSRRCRRCLDYLAGKEASQSRRVRRESRPDTPAGPKEWRRTRIFAAGWLQFAGVPFYSAPPGGEVALSVFPLPSSCLAISRDADAGGASGTGAADDAPALQRTEGLEAAWLVRGRWIALALLL